MGIQKGFLRLVFILCAIASSGAAQERFRLGHTIVFTNDLIGDGQDRWRTGSVAYSFFTGPRWQGQRPEVPGQLLEFRLRAEIIAPANLEVTNPKKDRRYAGALSFGLFTHYSRDNADARLGLEFVMMGPQTGLSRLHDWFHHILGTDPSAATSTEIRNITFPTASFSYALNYRYDTAPFGGVLLRPFFEAQVGVETYLRGGVDLRFGDPFNGDMFIRDVVTGNLFPGIRDDQPSNWSFGLGADVALMGENFYLQRSKRIKTTLLRPRVRAGIYYQGDRLDLFYGVSWLGREFTRQPEGQVVGAISLRYRF